jgi:hypothetical protein
MIDRIIDNWKDEGMHFEASYPWSNQFQKIVWKEDYCNNIKQEFDIMCEKIERFDAEDGQTPNEFEKERIRSFVTSIKKVEN